MIENISVRFRKDGLNYTVGIDKTDSEYFHDALMAMVDLCKSRTQESKDSGCKNE